MTTTNKKGDDCSSPFYCVGAAGFEPATSWSQTRRDDRTTLRPEQKCPISIRLPNAFGASLSGTSPLFGGAKIAFFFTSAIAIEKKRWERDSNSRYSYPYDSLANCWFKPLTHPTEVFKERGRKNNKCNVPFNKITEKKLGFCDFKNHGWKRKSP